MKSVVAANAVRAMNPDIRVEAHANRVGPETTHIYHDEFYQNLSGVCNALDNILARKFSDSQCLQYNRPLLESGTLGSKAHMQIVIPGMTESYSSQTDPPEKGIPLCTLHRFPTSINHTCMWARATFTELFEEEPRNVNKFLDGELDIERLKENNTVSLIAALTATEQYHVTSPARDFDDCVHWARLKFEEFFNFSIRDLQTQLPLDTKTAQGVPFWGSGKRYPSPVEYDASNEYHAQFVTTAATLRARAFGIAPEGNVPERAAGVTVPPWRFGGRPIGPDDGTPPPPSDDEREHLDEMIAALSPLIRSTPKRFTVQEFEKDNDANSHMAFIAAAANIRAINYEIEPQDMLTLKKIAGNIIPAIATTTAAICGFVALEMYKVHAIVPKTIRDFRFAIINLAINMYALSEPRACQTTTCPANGETYSMWTHWQIDGDITLGQLLRVIKDRYKLNVEILNTGSILLYSQYHAPTQEVLDTKITDLRIQYGQPPLAPGQNLIFLDAACVDEQGESIDTPQFVLKVS
jgi:ubiquitin-activating enzyme E1